MRTVQVGLATGGDRCGLAPSSRLMLAASFVIAGVLSAAADPCTIPKTFGPTINIKDKGAKGDGRTNDTEALRRAIDEMSGKGGTVFIPDGTYMIDAVGDKRVMLKSRMTLKLSAGATLRVIPNAEKHYQLLSISKVSNVAVIGGTLEGDRNDHLGTGGEWGFGLMIANGAENVTVSGTKSKNMWGDGFYIETASNVALCGVIADRNRRQGLSIIDGQDISIVGSTFSNTQGTDPSAGIDMEPDKPTQKITRVSIQRSKFLNNHGPGILVHAQKSTQNVTDISITNNYFSTTRPIKIKYARGVLDSAICNNRYVVRRDRPNDISSVAIADDFVTVTAACGDVGIHPYPPIVRGPDSRRHGRGIHGERQGCAGVRRRGSRCAPMHAERPRHRLLLVASAGVIERDRRQSGR